MSNRKMRDKIIELIDLTLNACLPWISTEEGTAQFVDPLDHKEISAHYGATHMAAALIIYGEISDAEEYIQKGETLLNSVLDRWDKNKELPDFHHDFNNFALCVIDSFTGRCSERIRKTVLETRDTSFDTVNWLPMRWYVNRARYDWTGDTAYKDICESCHKKIKEASFSDGFIDDMLPKGRSFSLQYDVATVAFLQYLRVTGGEIDLSLETGALLNAVCPDGDINYFGRGTNQIFAWGLWVYLLASSGQKELGNALGYLEKHLPVMLSNNNIMLNDYPGQEKYMWWDYHYCSVYTAHLLLWLVLAYRDFEKSGIEPELVTDGSSGVHVYRGDDAFAVVFDGRSEYFAEAGPVVAAAWTKRSGIIFKGSFGPWHGLFGNRYIQPDVTLRNFMGLTEIETEQHKQTLLMRIRSKVRGDAVETVRPCFVIPDVDVSSGLVVTYHVDKPLLLNIPLLNGGLSVTEDGGKLELYEAMRLRNQYGWITLKQCLVKQGSTIEAEII